MNTGTFSSDISRWRSYIACARDHPSLPVGQHQFQPDRVADAAMLPLYRVVYQLYTTVSESTHFREPVNALESGAFDYYKRIDRPMSLRQVLDQMVGDGRKYSSVQSALADLDTVWANCEKYNGNDPHFTPQARRCRQWLKEKYAEAALNVTADRARVELLLEAIEQQQSDALMLAVHKTIEAMRPDLIHDEEVDMENINVGLLQKLEELVRNFRPGSSRREAGGRESPRP